MMHAPRLPLRILKRPARGVLRAFACLAGVALALAAPAAKLSAQEITKAEYASPTSEYPHGVLGDAIEWKTLEITVADATGTDAGRVSGSSRLTYKIDAGEGLVFEDTQPRLWDMTGDGLPEVVAVQSHQYQGARLVVFGLAAGKPNVLAATPHIGTRFRWLAPVGAADLDGDGNIEVAFVDRPHLAKTMRVWRLEGDDFYEIATLPGVSNHRIGEDFITGGVRNCGQGPELVIADARWSQVLATRLNDGKLSSQPLGPFSASAVKAALNCN